MSLDTLIENINPCPFCGEKHEYTNVHFVEDLTYLVSKCIDCEYENIIKINHIVQI